MQPQRPLLQQPAQRCVKQHGAASLPEEEAHNDHHSDHGSEDGGDGGGDGDENDEHCCGDGSDGDDNEDNDGDDDDDDDDDGRSDEDGNGGGANSSDYSSGGGNGVDDGDSDAKPSHARDCVAHCPDPSAAEQDLPMIQCCNAHADESGHNQGWFHVRCAGLEAGAETKSKHYFCPLCRIRLQIDEILTDDARFCSRRCADEQSESESESAGIEDAEGIEGAEDVEDAEGIESAEDAEEIGDAEDVEDSDSVIEEIEEAEDGEDDGTVDGGAAHEGMCEDQAEEEDQDDIQCAWVTGCFKDVAHELTDASCEDLLEGATPKLEDGSAQLLAAKCEQLAAAHPRFVSVLLGWLSREGDDMLPKTIWRDPAWRPTIDKAFELATLEGSEQHAALLARCHQQAAAVLSPAEEAAALQEADAHDERAIARGDERDRGVPCDASFVASESDTDDEDGFSILELSRFAAAFRRKCVVRAPPGFCQPNEAVQRLALYDAFRRWLLLQPNHQHLAACLTAEVCACILPDRLPLGHWVVVKRDVGED